MPKFAKNAHFYDMSLKGNFPLYDIPVDYIMDDEVSGEILDLYKMFPEV